MPAARATALAWLALIGCQERVGVVPMGDGAALVALLGPDGTWLDQSFLPPGAQSAFEAKEGALLVVFPLARDQLLDRSGRALDPERLAGLTAEDAQNGGEQGCGRCRVPGGPRLYLGPGDHCPIPPPRTGTVYRFSGQTATARDDPLLLESVGARLRVAWPGPCDTTTPDLSEVTPIVEVVGLTPAEAPVRPQRVAIDLQGTVLGIRSGFGTFVGPFGDGASGAFPSSYFGDLLPPESRLAPFLIAAGALFQFDVSAGLRPVPLPEPAWDARGLARLEDGFVHVTGADARGGGAVARCRLGPAGRIEWCLSEDIGCRPEPLVDAVASAGGAIALGIDGTILRRRGSRWRCQSRPLQTDGAAGFRPTRIGTVARFGGRVWVCADGFGDGRPGAVGVLAADLRSEPLDFEVVDFGPGFSCGGFIRVAGTPERWLLLRAEGGGLLFDGTGELVARCSGSLDCLPSWRAVFSEAAQHGIVDLAFSPLGAAVATDLSGRIHRLAPGEARASVVYGDRSAEPLGGAALARGPEEPWVFFGSRGPRRLLREGGACRSARLEPHQPGPGWTLESESGARPTGRLYPGRWLDRARAAAWIPERGFIVGGQDLATGDAWIRRVSPESGRVEERRLDPDLLPVRIAPLDRGRALWVTARRLYVVQPDSPEPEPIATEWDDPTTVRQESPWPGESEWRSAGSAAGITWAFGIDRLARVVLDDAGEARAELWWSRHILQVPVGRDIWAGAGTEPDTFVVIERVYGFNGRADLRLGIVSPACAGPGRSLGLCPLLEGALAPLTERRPEAPGPMIFHERGITISTYGQGLLLRGSSGAFLPFGLLNDATPFPGGLLFSGQGAVAAACLSP